MSGSTTARRRVHADVHPDVHPAPARPAAPRPRGVPAPRTGHTARGQLQAARRCLAEAAEATSP
ncbi:MAG TPA: hypothetical protein VHJ17_13515, partial [Thermomonospora sp.]|nr:hypothetical protein [Thermomonospora sp.]